MKYILVVTQSEQPAAVGCYLLRQVQLNVESGTFQPVDHVRAIISNVRGLAEQPLTLRGIGDSRVFERRSIEQQRHTDESPATRLENST